MNPSCWLTRRRLDAYQDDELSPGLRARVDRHLARCSTCPGELAAVRRLRQALALDDVSDPLGPAWDAFWPQVRARIAAEPAVREAAGPVRIWAPLAGRRLILAPALAAVAMAILAILAPWKDDLPVTPPRAVPGPSQPMVAGVEPAVLDDVVVQSIETDNPDAPVMVYSSPDSDVTMLWVFGLERTRA